MISLKLFDHAAPSFRVTRGFGGRRRNSHSSSVRAMVNQILHGCARIAGHRLPRGFDEPFITLRRARDCLRSRFGRWFGYAGQDRFGEGVHQRKERLLPPADAENLVRNAIKACSNFFLGADHLGSSFKFAADRRANERAGTCVTFGLRRLLDLTLLFAGKPDRDSDIPGSTRALRHKNTYTYKGSGRHFWTIPPAESASNRGRTPGGFCPTTEATDGAVHASKKTPTRS